MGCAVEVGIPDCLQLFNVMVTIKCPKGSFEGLLMLDKEEL